MLTPEQIDALREAATQISDPINKFLIEDIARRIAEAGQLTSTAAYQVWRAQQLGLSRVQIRRELRKLLGVSQQEIRQLMEQSAEVGYNFGLSRLPTNKAIPFAENLVMQQIVSAAVSLAQDDFTNITQTLGMVDPYGNALPLQQAYRSAMDFAFKQVSIGATDYNTAIRRATKNIADMGVRVIDYESGVHTSIEAATRRSVMGGIGLMSEQISQQMHDDMGADGWEISAHEGSAPDHEDIQGHQYSDERYKALNNSLTRRIGTLNCGHVAFPIIIGVSKPIYTDKQLEAMKARNKAGITYQGKHYTQYQSEQMQRKIERAIRKQKKRILVDESTGDSDKLTTDKIKLRRLREEYKEFSSAAGLRTQNERLFIAKERTPKVTNLESGGTLNERDRDAINQYKSAKSYGLNAALRGDAPLSDDDRQLTQDLDQALTKLPKYKGTVYRSISSDMMLDVNNFFAKRKPGALITELDYTSASVEVYDNTLDVQMIIQSLGGRDMRDYNPLEQEILFPRGTRFRVCRIDGKTIYLEEEP